MHEAGTIKPGPLERNSSCPLESLRGICDWVDLDWNLRPEEGCSGGAGSCPVDEVIADSKAGHKAVALPIQELHPIADAPIG